MLHAKHIGLRLISNASNRPTALLAVYYRYIKVILLPDPYRGERPRVLVEILYKYTKGYLGEKDGSVLPSIPRLLLYI